MNRRELMRQTLGVTLLVLLGIGCSTDRDTSPATITGLIDIDDVPAPLNVQLVKNEEDLKLGTLFSQLSQGGYFGVAHKKRTDANGLFAFDGIVPGKYHLFVEWGNIKGQYDCRTDPSVAIAVGELMEGTISKPGPIYSGDLLTDSFEVKVGDRISIEVHCERSTE